MTDNNQNNGVTNNQSSNNNTQLHAYSKHKNSTNAQHHQNLQNQQQHQQASSNGNADNVHKVIDGKYMSQDEEAERDGLLNRAWENQQKKSFTAWCNSHLRNADTQIESIEEDFRNGLKLMLLLEVISNETLPKPDRGKMRFHKIANVNKALDFIASKDVKLVSIGAEEIVDGNVKMTLGLIWTIISRFAIQNIEVEASTAKEGLLLWCQRKTAPYKNVNVHNFHNSWKDGLAFCALIHRHRPDLIDYSKLSFAEPTKNLNLAFDVAEKHLNIPKMLDVEDIKSSLKPDERAVMTYISSFYHTFANAQQAETAANRICKVLRVNQDNEKFMDDYEKSVDDLLNWIKITSKSLNERATDNSLHGAQRKLEDFRRYRQTEKPSRVEQKAKLETNFNTLQTKLRLNNRPAYVPSPGKQLRDIAAAWRDLQAVERSFEEWLLSEMMRLERLEHLAKKYHHKCDIHESWTIDKEAMLQSRDFRTSRLNDVRAMKKKHEAFESDLEVHEERVQQIVSIASEFETLGYRDRQATSARCKRIEVQWAQIKSLTQTRQQDLEATENLLERVDQMHLEFAKRATPFNNWLDSSQESLVDMFIVHTVDEIQRLISAHEKFKLTLDDADKEYKEISELESRINELSSASNDIVKSSTDNPYTTLVSRALASKWNSLRSTLIPEREQVLQRELTRQERNEQLRMQFAKLAEYVGPWIEKQMDACAASGIGASESLEDQLEELRKLEVIAHQFQPQLDELEKIHQQVQEQLIFENPYTEYTMETLRVGWEQLLTAIRKHINEVENQILTRDSKGITQDQLNDFRASFNHFDKQKCGQLSLEEFESCLVSLGYNLRNDRLQQVTSSLATINNAALNGTNTAGSCSSTTSSTHDSLSSDFRRILSVVDPDDSKYVTFDSFLHFMTSESTDRDTAEQLLDSFKILAGEKPYITASELRHELSAEQAEYCIARMKPYVASNCDDDQQATSIEALDYTSFAASLYGCGNSAASQKQATSEAA